MGLSQQRLKRLIQVPALVSTKTAVPPTATDFQDIVIWQVLAIFLMSDVTLSLRLMFAEQRTCRQQRRVLGARSPELHILRKGCR